MAWGNFVNNIARKFAGNAVDWTATKFGNITGYKLPELGLSEKIAGGRTLFTVPKAQAADTTTSTSTGGGGGGWGDPTPPSPINSNPTPLAPTNTNTTSPSYSTTAPTGTSSSTSDTGGTPTNTFSQYFGGTLYNDYAGYLNAVNTAAQSEYDKQRKALDAAYSSGLLSYDQRQHALEVNRQNINTQAGDLMSSYQNNLKTLDTTRTQALQGQAGAFARLSPDVQQSEQGVLAGQTQDQYNTGLSNVNQTKQRNDTAIAQSLDQLGQAQTNLGTEKAQYGTDYQNNIGSLDQAKQQQVDSTLNQYLDYLNPGGYALNLGAVTPDVASVNANTSGYDIAPILNKIAGLIPNATGVGGAQVKRPGSVTTPNTPSIEDILNYLYAGA